ncbi:MAG: PorV/PorQ family protein [bacterium]|nr:PorV/PorQ family protein [bacterium]
MSKLIIPFILLVAVFSSPASSQAEEAEGGYAGAFLQVPVGARPTAMGGAYRAIASDGAGPLFNPAGASGLKRPLLGSSYRVLKLDRKLGYLTALFPIKNQAVLGAQWLYAGSGSVEARDTDGYLQGHDISQNSHQFTILFAKKFERWIGFGANMSYLQSHLSDISANSVGFDFGVMIYVEQLLNREKRDKLPVRDIQIGITVQDVAKKFRWNSEEYVLAHTTGGLATEQEDDVPVEFGLGVSGRLLDRRLLLTSDFVRNSKQGPRIHAGAEFYVMPVFALRTGFSDGRFTAGTGYLFKISKRQLVIDYAFTTDKADEGSEHIFSFDLLF